MDSKPISAESRFQDRDNEIVSLVEQGESIEEIAKRFAIGESNVQRIIRRHKKSAVHALHLTDGINQIPVAHISTSRGFMHACRFAIRHFSGTFSRLELPQWKLSDGVNVVLLKDFKEESA